MNLRIRYNELFVCKIFAVGFNKRFMYITYDYIDFYWVRISEDLYSQLKFLGVPTSQYLSRHKSIKH